MSVPIKYVHPEHEKESSPMLQIQLKNHNDEMFQTTAPIDSLQPSTGFISTELYSEIFELPESWPLRNASEFKNLEMHINF